MTERIVFVFATVFFALVIIALSLAFERDRSTSSDRDAGVPVDY